MLADFITGSGSSRAHTLTQKLVQLLSLRMREGFESRVDIDLASLIVEKRWTKKEILVRHADLVPMGTRHDEDVVGVRDAAHVYLGKDVGAATLPEAALLAAIIQDPIRNQPARHSVAAQLLRIRATSGLLQAIKVLPEHLTRNPDLRQRFEREAKTVSSLNHPHPRASRRRTPGRHRLPRPRVPRRRVAP
jgi:membrane peptidoglycan carboxypeptidase